MTIWYAKTYQRLQTTKKAGRVLMSVIGIALKVAGLITLYAATIGG